MADNRIIITLGDPWGIGPEITLKALEKIKVDPSRIILAGSSVLWERLLDGKPDPAGQVIDIPFEDPFISGHPPIAGGVVPLQTLQTASVLLKNKEAAALVTAPINKTLIQHEEPGFVGHTEFLGNFFEVSEPTMFFVGPQLKTALVTTHVSMANLPSMITQKRILAHLENINRYLKSTGKTQAKIGVCGLNPHAGEHGAFGREEIEVIAPAVVEACKEGIPAEGPFPADTLYKKGLDGTYEVILAMYHDQALTLFKSTDQNRGVNVTLGLPILRTSPDHGTAYDIAGKGIADPSSMEAAIRLALEYVF